MQRRTVPVRNLVVKVERQSRHLAPSSLDPFLQFRQKTQQVAGQPLALASSGCLRYQETTSILGVVPPSVVSLLRRPDRSSPSESLLVPRSPLSLVLTLAVYTDGSPSVRGAPPVATKAAQPSSPQATRADLHSSRSRIQCAQGRTSPGPTTPGRLRSQPAPRKPQAAYRLQSSVATRARGAARRLRPCVVPRRRRAGRGRSRSKRERRLASLRVGGHGSRLRCLRRSALALLLERRHR